MNVPALLLIVCLATMPSMAQPARGPLRVHEENPRYFTDGSGRAVLLAGSHTWSTIPDMSPSDPPAAFDFNAFLDFLEGYGHNFIRLWTWELTTWGTAGNAAAYRPRIEVHNVSPHPWARTGPGDALDGKPKFNLEEYDPEYFRRLRSRVEEAGRRGFYASVMLFEGWGIRKSPDAWKHHPMNPANNVNGIDGDLDGDGEGIEIHTLGNRDITAIQEAYVRKTIDTVNDFDNVLYEISNETHPNSTGWQYHMIGFIRDYEKTKPSQHPAGMTYQQPAGLNSHLFSSPADWISPGKREYREAIFQADGSKVILNDTDHLWGIGGTEHWVWKTFLQGMNPIFMDPYDGVVLGNPFDPKHEPVRKALGQVLRISRQVALEKMIPAGELASSGYCLARKGAEYLIYVPAGESVSVDLAGASGAYSVRWIGLLEGDGQPSEAASGGARRSFSAPVPEAAILYLRAQ